MKFWRERLIEYGTYAIVLLTPVLFWGGRYLSYSTSKTFFFYGAVEIVFIFWVYQAYIDPSYRLSKKDFLFFIPFLAYIFWLTITSIFGLDPETSFWSSLSRGTGLITLYHVTVFIFVITSLVKKNGLVKYGHKLLTWFIGGVFILTLSVWLGNEGFNLPIEVLEKSKGGGLMGNSSLTATVLVFAIFLQVFLILTKETKRKSKIILSLVLIATLFSPLFINTFGNSISGRGAMLGIIVGVLAFVPLLLVLSKKRLNKILGLTLVVFGIVIFAFFWSRLMTPQTKIHEKFVESTTESRFIFWGSAKEAIKERPFLGYGPENYRIAGQKYFNPKLYTLGSAVETWNDRAHNIIFDTGVSGGWPAIIFYFSFLFSLFYLLYRACVREKISRLQGATLGALIVAYLFQNLFVFDSLVSFVALSVLTGLVFGVNTSDTKTEQSKKKPSVGKKNLLVVLLILIFIPTWVCFAWMPSRKVVALTKVTTLSLNKRPDHYADLLKGSVVGNAFEVSNIADDAYHIYHDNRDELENDAETLPYALRDLEKLTEYLEVVAKREPYDHRLHIDLARLYLEYMYMSDRFNDETLIDKSLIVVEHAIELSPNDPQGYWTKAVIQFRSGDINDARMTAKKAIEIAPYIDFSHELLERLSK